MRIRELGGWGRLKKQASGRPTRLYSMTGQPRYQAKSTLSTRRQTHSIQSWVPYV